MNRACASPDVSWLDEARPEEMKRLLDSLYRVERLFGAVSDVDALLMTILEESREIADADGSSLLLYDPANEELYFHIALGEEDVNTDSLKREIRLKLGEGIAGKAAATRASINVENAAEDPRVYRRADEVSTLETRSLLAVPLVDGDDLVGVLEVLNKSDGGAFTEFDRHFLEMFSGIAASAIARARLIQAKMESERLAAVGQTVAGLSHYTKNVLTGLTVSMELVDRGLDTKNEVFIDQGWPVMKRSVGRLTHIVEDMLAYSKDREPLVEPTDIRELFDEVLEEVRALLTQRDVQIDVDVSRVDGRAQVDPRGLHRCLLNLMTNAADAVSAHRGRILLSARGGVDGSLVITLEDNGPGVPESDRTRIFDPFFSTKGSRGTGLGLAVTEKIIREHGGTVEVDSSSLGGARFTITLPPAPMEHDDGLESH